MWKTIFMLNPFSKNQWTISCRVLAVNILEVFYFHRLPHVFIVFAVVRRQYDDFPAGMLVVARELIST